MSPIRAADPSIVPVSIEMWRVRHGRLQCTGKNAARAIAARWNVDNFAVWPIASGLGQAHASEDITSWVELLRCGTGRALLDPYGRLAVGGSPSA